MSKTYKKQEIIEMCENASKDMRNFYKQNFVNYKGKAKEGEFYTEIVAEWLLKNKSLFDKIASIERSTSYKVEGHSGKTYRESNRKEEITAKQLFTAAKDYEGFGRIIDYQTPLKNPGGKNNDGLGKIDLLTQNDKNKSVYILELKKIDSDDTMLHCVLEAYTYLRIIAKEKLLNDFKIPTSYTLKASPLVYSGGRQHDEYRDKKRVYLHKLMEELDSYPFFIEEVSFKILPPEQ